MKPGLAGYLKSIADEVTCVNFLAGKKRKTWLRTMTVSDNISCFGRMLTYKVIDLTKKVRIFLNKSVKMKRDAKK